MNIFAKEPHNHCYQEIENSHIDCNVLNSIILNH